MGAYPPGEGQLLGSTQRYQDGLESVECTQWATALLPRDGMQCHAAGCSCSGYVACMVGTSVGSRDAVLAAYIGNARVDALRAIHPQRPSIHSLPTLGRLCGWRGHCWVYLQRRAAVDGGCLACRGGSLSGMQACQVCSQKGNNPD